MKMIIAGSRSIDDICILTDALEACPFTAHIKEIVSGTAKGADRLGETYAQHYKNPLKGFPADWEAYGRAAGIICNNEMAHYADALLALWDGKSRGTAHMIAAAKGKRLKVFVHVVSRRCAA